MTSIMVINRAACNRPYPVKEVVGDCGVRLLDDRVRLADDNASLRAELAGVPWSVTCSPRRCAATLTVAAAVLLGAGSGCVHPLAFATAKPR